MADTKTTGLTANTAPALTDIIPMVDDPGGSAATQKITIQNLRRQLFPYSVCGGRLTLTTGTPVTTADVTAAATLYFTPYSAAFGCGQVGLYDGSAGWDILDFTELSLSLVGYTASKPYDIWIYNNSGTAALESTIWTDATTRATALTTQDGIYVKTGATTRRYLGTIYINASGAQTDDSLIYRFVWNYYNRVTRPLYVSEASAHTYATNSYRAWNNSATSTKLSFIIGVVNTPNYLSLYSVYKDAGFSSTGIGYDSTTTTIYTNNNETQKYVGVSYSGYHFPGIGFHYYIVEEYSGTGTSNFTKTQLHALLMG